VSIRPVDASLKHTPLESLHAELGGKLVPFAGWFMPVQYKSIIDEHQAVRTAAGIFDISHMGQVVVSGTGARAWLERVLASPVAALAVGSGQYSFLLNEAGGVIDDLIVYRDGQESFFLVINASMIDVDVAWMRAQLEPAVVLDDQSQRWAGMAVQGPEALGVARGALPGVALPERNGIVRALVDGREVVVCRTGYTGEDGFEFFCEAALGQEWFRRFMRAGAVPCGLGARDSLRLEMGFPLNGNDLSPTRTPLEAGLGFFVGWDKPEFIGRAALMEQKASGLGEKLVGIRYTGAGAPPRAHYAVHAPGGEAIGELSSGGLSPSLREGIGMAYLPVAWSKLGTAVEVEVRGRKFPAVVVKKPFYKKPSSGHSEPQKA
jgi:aminomethyltransferase